MEQEMKDSKKLHDEKEAAEILGVSVSTLQMRRHKRLPPSYVKIGRSVRYRPEDLDNFISEQRVAV